MKESGKWMDGFTLRGGCQKSLRHLLCWVAALFALSFENRVYRLVTSNKVGWRLLQKFKRKETITIENAICSNTRCFVVQLLMR
jgi:hypothetical protein